MRLTDLFPGKVLIEVTSADREAVLRRIERAGITVYHVSDQGETDLSLWVDRRDLRRLRSLLGRHGDRVKVKWGRGLYRAVIECIRRPVLTVGCLLILALTLYVPTRVLVVEVEGAREVPAGRILEEASVFGLGYGTLRRDIRSEQLKNSLLQVLPELQWVGVNTYGCRAVISVKERAAQETQQERKGVGHISSVCDAVITEITVTKGTAMCKPGDRVAAGQVLVSGYSDRGLFVRGEVAEGEVFGQTERQVTAYLTNEVLTRTGSEGVKRYHCLLFGKKRFFFSKGSGISDATCGKMYEEYYLTLPGGFRLPIGIGVEEISEPRVEVRSISSEEAEEILSQQADRTLSRQLLSGEVLTRELSYPAMEGVHVVLGRYGCRELVGVTQIEENLDRYETDRTNRERGES